jgi:hypothetical protein
MLAAAGELNRDPVGTLQAILGATALPAQLDAESNDETADAPADAVLGGAEDAHDHDGRRLATSWTQPWPASQTASARSSSPTQPSDPSRRSPTSCPAF